MLNLQKFLGSNSMFTIQRMRKFRSCAGQIGSYSSKSKASNIISVAAIGKVGLGFIAFNVFPTALCKSAKTEEVDNTYFGAIVHELGIENVEAVRKFGFFGFCGGIALKHLANIVILALCL